MLNEHVINPEATVILKERLLRDKSYRYVEPNPFVIYKISNRLTRNFLRHLLNVFTDCGDFS